MRRRYEFADDALVDEDGDGDAEDADEGEVAAGPAEVVLQVLPAAAPVLDEPVLVHLHPSPHLNPRSSTSSSSASFSPHVSSTPLLANGNRAGRCSYILVGIFGNGFLGFPFYPLFVPHFKTQIPTSKRSNPGHLSSRCNDSLFSTYDFIRIY